ncbi:MAG: CDP-alcohol phosphatidyltransferase family protein [Acidilobaceae archaeon]
MCLRRIEVLAFKNVEEVYLAIVKKLKIRPNHLTLLGLCLALATPLAAYANNAIIVAVLIVLSSLADALDGYTARVLKATSKWGAFLDSTADRVADSMFVLSFMLLGLSPTICYLLLTFSLLVSYTRARGEALGTTFKGVGIIERQERAVLFILIAFLIAYDKQVAEIGAIVTLAFTVITVIQRVLHAKKRLTEVE